MKHRTPVAYKLHRIAYFVGRYRFWILAGLAAVAFGLGWWGYCNNQPTGPARSQLDAIYKSLQLFALTFDSSLPVTPSVLDAARFLAAFVVFSTIVSTLAKIFYERLQVTRLHLFGRDHVVLCGLGHDGVRLVEALRRRGQGVVVLEPDAAHEHLAHCREHGAVVLTGKAANPWHLRRARVDRAALLLVLFPDDRLNAETVVHACRLTERRRFGVLRCVAQIADPELAVLLHEYAHPDVAGGRFDLEVFDGDDACARAMLREAALRVAGAPPARLLILGLGRTGPLGGLGERLLLRAARDWHIDNPTSATRLAVVAVDPRATRVVAALKAKYPFLDQLCAFTEYDLDPIRASPTDWPLPPGGVTVAFVCLPDEEAAALAARRLRDVLPPPTPIVVGVREEGAGWVELLHRMDGRAGRLAVVALSGRARHLALAPRPRLEQLAQAVHQEYLLGVARLPHDPTRPALKPWEDLDEFLRESNRSQAEDFDEQLRRVQCHRVPIGTGLARAFEFTDREVKLLGRREHERWCEFMARYGWRYGPDRKHKVRLHPCLVPWEQLSKEIQELDNNFVRQIPRILARADFQVVRDAISPPAAAAAPAGSV